MHRKPQVPLLPIQNPQDVFSKLYNGMIAEIVKKPELETYIRQCEYKGTAKWFIEFSDGRKITAIVDGPNTDVYWEIMPRHVQGEIKRNATQDEIDATIAAMMHSLEMPKPTMHLDQEPVPLKTVRGIQ